jgi:hypothetical protein
MSAFQQTPIFCDVCRPFAYAVKQTSNQNYIQISQAGGSVFGSITLMPQNYFVATALRCVTNYDDVAPVVATADSDAILPRSFTPDNFTLKISRGNSNNYSNFPIPQSMIGSSGYRAGKIFPLPQVYGPRTNFQFQFQDTTQLFLLDALSEGAAIPLRIDMFLEGYNVPFTQWTKFCRIFPSFAAVFGAPPSL